MSNKDVIDDLKKQGLDEYGSWAVYGKKAMAISKKRGDIDDSDILGFPKDISNEDLAKKVKPDYMLVSASVSKRGIPDNGSWSNFHDTRPMSNDDSIVKIISNTEFYGAYMTDIIKFPDGIKKENKNSDDLYYRMKKAYMNKKDTDDYKSFKFSMNEFRKELDIIKPKRIICFGCKAYNIFQMIVREPELKILDNVDDVKAIQTIHYSDSSHYSSEDKYNCFTGNKDDIMISGKFKWQTIDEIRNLK